MMARKLPIVSVGLAFTAMVLSAVLVSRVLKGSETSLLYLGSCTALVSFLISRFIFRLSNPFSIISAATPLCIALSVDVNWLQDGSSVQTYLSWFFFVGFIFFASIHLPAMWSHVPYYPTPSRVDAQLIQILSDRIRKKQTTVPFKMIDIGCGTARLLCALAKNYPAAEFQGYEISLLPYLKAKWNTRNYGNIRIRFKSFWNVSLQDFDLVYAFLSPAVMEKLAMKAGRELRKDAILISNSFVIDNPSTHGITKQRLFPTSTDAISNERGTVLIGYQLT